MKNIHEYLTIESVALCMLNSLLSHIVGFDIYVVAVNVMNLNYFPSLNQVINQFYAKSSCTRVVTTRTVLHQ